MRLLLALVLLGLSAVTLAIDPMPFRDDAERARFQSLMRELRCLQCQNESLAESNADMAKDMRRLAFEMMREGKSDAEIVAFFVARYGDFVRFRPAVEGKTLLLWFGPVLIAGFGLVWAILTLRRRTAALEPRASAPDRDDWD